MEMALDDQLEGTSLLCENTYIPELPNGTGTYNQYESTVGGISHEFNTLSSYTSIQYED